MELVKFLDILKNCADVFLFSMGITKSSNVYLWLYGLCVCDTYKTQTSGMCSPVAEARTDVIK